MSRPMPRARSQRDQPMYANGTTVPGQPPAVRLKGSDELKRAEPE
jgi:hypothetical protein